MDDRKKRILQAIIQDYIKSAEPVGSRTLARNYNLGISPATVRNEMYDLEQLGFLEQPHTSAGRVPSSKGYRYYIDSMNRNTISSEDVASIHELWERQGINRVDFFQSVAKLISQISHSMSVFLAPTHDSSAVRHIHVLPLDLHKLVMVVITDTGALDNELMYFDEAVNVEVLESTATQFSNALQDILLRDITKENLLAIISTIDGSRRILLVMVDTLYRAISKRRLFYTVGTTELLQQPEFRNIDKVQPILSLVEEQEQLSKLLSNRDNAESSPVNIKIGTENSNESLRDMSVIQADFNSPKEHVGTLAILGPTRMEYRRIIGILTYMQQLIDSIVKDDQTKR